MSQNKITTLGYFCKRLKDNGFIVWKMFNKYSDQDARKWTVLINPSQESVFITCIMNYDGLNSIPAFEFNTGIKSVYKSNITLQTESIEVLIKHLLSLGIDNKSELFIKDTGSEEETLPMSEFSVEKGINNHDER